MKSSTLTGKSFRAKAGLPKRTAKTSTDIQKELAAMSLEDVKAKLKKHTNFLKARRSTQSLVIVAEINAFLNK